MKIPDFKTQNIKRENKQALLKVTVEKNWGLKEKVRVWETVSSVQSLSRVRLSATP